MLLHDRSNAGQLGKVLCGFDPVRWISILYVAVRGNRFVRAVACFAALELVNILANQIELDPVASNESQRLLQDFQLPEAWEFVNHAKQAMFVILLGTNVGKGLLFESQSI